MFSRIKEECGVFGIYSKNDREALAFPTSVGLATLQHRGEESCGIAINDGGVIKNYKDVGLVSSVFKQHILEEMPLGKMSIGHVRYSTTGEPKKENAQPMVTRHAKGNLAVVHNGNLTNAYELRQELQKNGAIFDSTSDTEVICYIIARERLKTDSIEQAVVNAMKYIKGAYSLLVMSSQKLIAVRDPNGIRPLCMGKIGEDIVFSSETCAIDILGGEFVRDINPGEVVVVTNNEIKSIDVRNGAKDGLCIFEYIYFARPDSVINGLSVHKFREEAGKYLSIQAPVDADFVAGVPDSGLDAALGYSKHSKIPYDMAFVKSKYIGRTFIQSTQKTRRAQVALKLNPISATVKDKRIVLVDDSIVRGNTLRKLVKNLKRAGAKEVHLRIASPAFVDVCYFGTDIDSKENLIANQMTIDEIREHLGADSLEYLSLENVRKIVAEYGVTDFCDGCFTGKYPIEVPKDLKKDRFEKIF